MFKDNRKPIVDDHHPLGEHNSLSTNVNKVLAALRGGDLLHTSAVARRANLDQAAASFILTRLWRAGEVVRYHPRKTNELNEKLWRIDGNIKRKPLEQNPSIQDARPDRFRRFLSGAKASADPVGALHLERVSAVEISQEEVPAGVHLTRGEVGCFMSHIRIWEKIVRGRIEEAVVFEDDVDISSLDIGREIDDCRKELPSGWHVVFLGVNYFRTREDLSRCFLLQEEGSYGAHAYFINLAGAARALRAVQRMGITMPVDIFLSSKACDCRYFLHRANKVRPSNLSDTDTQRLR
ncbi:hypothetical protein HDV00_008640 [Rhizophlyctis rosea]|nr:hypothetical protein HDV00_008640 [Rhizophlyctis rosea]